VERVGYVSKVIGDKAEVEVKRMSACGSEGCSSCGGGCSVPSVFVTMPNTLKAKEGNFVEIKTKSRNVLKYTFLTYMIPFFMLIIGIIMGMGVFKYAGFKSYEGFGFLTGVIFLALSFLIIKRIDRKVAEEKNLQFEMIKIL